MLTVLAVVTHLGFFGVRSVTSGVDDVFGDAHVLVISRTRSRGVNRDSTGDVDFLLVRGAEARAVNGRLADDGASLVGGTVGGTVNGGDGYAGFFAVVALDAGTVLALGSVNDRVVRAVGAVDLNARLGVGRLRPDIEEGKCQ